MATQDLTDRPEIPEPNPGLKGFCDSLIGVRIPKNWNSHAYTVAASCQTYRLTHAAQASKVTQPSAPAVFWRHSPEP
jgi:hypothetical protein